MPALYHVDRSSRVRFPAGIRGLETGAGREGEGRAMNEQTETFWGDEIQAELEHQEEIGDTKLDFTRPPAEWRRLLQHQLNEMIPANRMTTAIVDEENYRACLVKVAAL